MRQLPCSPETDSTSHHVPMGHFFARSSRRQETTGEADGMDVEGANEGLGVGSDVKGLLLGVIGAGEGLSVGLGVGSEVGFDVGFGDGEEV